MTDDSIRPGTPVRVSTEPPFSLLDGTPADPTTVIFRYRVGLLPETVWQHGIASEVVHDGPGAYHADVPTPVPAIYSYRWEGTGAVTATVEGSFLVRSIYPSSAYSYDPATDIGRLRLLIDDRDLSAIDDTLPPEQRSVIFDDVEVQAFLDHAAGDPFVAAATALVTIANSRSLYVVGRRIGRTNIDFGSLRSDLLRQAQALRDQSASIPADGIAERVYDDFSLRRVLTNYALRNS